MEEERKNNSEETKEEKLLMGVDEARALQAELEKAIQERDEYLDGWRRAKADLANYKKEEVKRLEEIGKFATEDLIAELLTVLSSFDLSLSVLEKNTAVEKGIYLIKNQLEDILRKYGVKKIDAVPGTTFQPMFHEAIGETEGGSSGTVAEEIEAGYLLHEKVLRPARVKVFK